VSVVIPDLLTSVRVNHDRNLVLDKYAHLSRS